MNISPGFDPNNNRITFNVKTNLLVKYFSNFSGLILNDKTLPKGIEVSQESENSAVISFPAPENAIKKETENMKAIAIDVNIVNKIENIVSMFVRSGIRKELKTTEFIPLYGYSIENLSKEIIQAYKNGRNYCIVKDYDEYLNMVEKNEYKFHQYVLSKELNKKDYMDVTLLIYNKNIEEVRNKFEKKLKLKNWC